MDQGSPVVVRMQGGLGNQLFQYAVGRSMSLRWNAPLLFDLAFYAQPPGPHIPRWFGLGAYHTAGMSAETRTIAVAEQRGSRARALLHRIHPRLAADRTRIERSFRFDVTVLHERPPILLDGYWQSERYFIEHSATIRKDLRLRHSIGADRMDLMERIRSTPSVSVHVRRGDYVSHPAAQAHFAQLGPDYYRTALRRIMDRAGSCEVFIFTDDPRWTREHIAVDLSATVLEPLPAERAHEDLLLMSSCRHHIMANSSFSWWGAWLDGRTDKQVVAPREWFNDPAMDTADLIPASWERI